MNGRPTDKPDRSVLASMASFVVIFIGMMACVVVVLTSTDSQTLIGAVVLLFGSIALIPLMNLRPERASNDAGPSWWQRWKRWRTERQREKILAEKRERREKHANKNSEWKLKKTDFVSTPFGQDYYQAGKEAPSTFVPTKQERPEPPAKK